MRGPTDEHVAAPLDAVGRRGKRLAGRPSTGEGGVNQRETCVRKVPLTKNGWKHAIQHEDDREMRLQRSTEVELDLAEATRP